MILDVDSCSLLSSSCQEWYPVKIICDDNDDFILWISYDYIGTYSWLSMSITIMDRDSDTTYCPSWYQHQHQSYILYMITYTWILNSCVFNIFYICCIVVTLKGLVLVFQFQISKNLNTLRINVYNTRSRSYS